MVSKQEKILMAMNWNWFFGLSKSDLDSQKARTERNISNLNTLKAKAKIDKETKFVDNQIAIQQRKLDAINKARDS